MVGESALLTEPGDPASLGESIRALVENRRLGETLASRDFDRVARHTWDNWARRIGAFSAKLVARQASA